MRRCIFRCFAGGGGTEEGRSFQQIRTASLARAAPPAALSWIGTISTESSSFRLLYRDDPRFVKSRMLEPSPDLVAPMVGGGDELVEVDRRC